MNQHPSTNGHPDEALFDEWTRDYALLGLRLDRVAPGTVDAWIGPPTWKERVAREDPLSPAEIRRAADSLFERLPGMGYDEARRAFLARQVTALGTIGQVLEGQLLPFADEVSLLLDVWPERVPETDFSEAHAEVDAALPGTGSLHDRMTAWKRSLDVPRERIGPALERVAGEVRRRTLQHYTLPPEESIEITLVENQPWGAYNWYLGNARSRVEVNTDLPLNGSTLADYLAHEGYPGHHTEHTLREIRQYREQAQGEYAIQLINTPESVVSEAIATCAGDLIFPEGEDLRWLAEEILPELGVSLDPEAGMRLRTALEKLSGVTGNAAFLLHVDGMDADQVAGYLMEWGLATRDEAVKRLEFLQSPLWRAYIFTYIEGHRLLSPLLQGEDRFEVFGRALTEPVYPTLFGQWRAAAQPA